MPVKDQIKEFFKGEILDDEESLIKYSKDASIFEIRPQLVLFPKDSIDIEKLVNFIKLNPHSKLSLTVRSAGTCMSGGPINDGIILDMTKYFNKVIQVNSSSAITQPGVFYRDFEKQTLSKNLLLPCYTSSKEINTVGGMVGNNSAGEKTLKYGQTKDWVKKLKVILVDGQEYTFGPITKTQLDKKIEQNNFEGKIYKRIFELIDENYQLIQNSKPHLSKNSAGYLLWEIWDGEIFDLSKLFVGSQGTLGVISEIEFNLVEPEPYSAMLVAELHELGSLDKIVNTVLQYKPESFECFDDQTLKYSLRFSKDCVKRFKENSFLSIYLQFLPDFLKQLRGTLPKLTLMANFTGKSKGEAIHHCLNAQEALSELEIHSEIKLDHLIEKYWVIRRESFSLLKNHSAKMKTAPFIDDIIVDPKFLPEFLPRLQEILEPYKKLLIYTIAGHIGNGNFHIIPLMDLEKNEVKEIIPVLSQKVFDLVFEFKGSMAAEHNDGLVRGPFLEKMFGEDMYQLFKEVKYIFDPNNIFNPHKKVDASFEYSYNLISHRQDMHHGS